MAKDPTIVDMKQGTDGVWAPTFPAKARRPTRRVASRAASAGVSAAARPSVVRRAAAPATGGDVRSRCIACGQPTETGVAVPIVGAVPVCARCNGLANFAFGVLKMVGG